ncbi:hypothetical protein AK88_05060 [Plasmodium fragile]|uniref:Uncharacterized protein n=1 Tax=Plasmodium fragile TaxID=5857 RepID=A0A0D9QHW9_PLAFR|nr:uncharacterized protein AK88_05060 [Plasmodium fragile]KJP85306.1 hypothetical protein AK88_05060 [Plasmodium fragile]
MNLESSHKNLVHTQNTENGNNSYKVMNQHVLKDDCTNETKKNEIWNQQVGYVNKNEKSCNINYTDTHFEEGEGDKNVEEKKIPLDLHEGHKLASQSKKGIPFCMETQDDTSCSSYCEGYPHEKYKEDKDALEGAEACEKGRCTDYSIADAGASYGWSERLKAGQDNFIGEETEVVTEKQTKKKTAKREVERNEVAPPTGLEKHDHDTNECGGESKADVPKQGTKKCTSRETLKKGKETNTSSIKNDKMLMKQKCSKIKESEKKTNDDILELKDENNSSKGIQTGAEGKPCNDKGSGVSNGKVIEEILKGERKEHQMESSSYDKRNDKKSKRKYSDENVNGKDDIGLHEKGNTRKKKKKGNDKNDHNLGHKEFAKTKEKKVKEEK